MSAIKIETGFTLVDCPAAACGVVFAIGDLFRARRNSDGRNFYCPNGHTMSYGESDADRLRQQLANTQGKLSRAEGTITHLRDQAGAAERSARAQRAANTRLRKRVANGVCPCCRRTFADLARHMSGQHPDYSNEPAEVQP